MDYTKAYLKLSNYQPEAIREKAARGGLGEIDCVFVAKLNVNFVCKQKFMSLG